MPAVISQHQLPKPGRFLALDADGYHLPADWYMRVAGIAAEVLHGERAMPDAFPVKEFQDYWTTRSREPEAVGSVSWPFDSSREGLQRILDVPDAGVRPILDSLLQIVRPTDRRAAMKVLIRFSKRGILPPNLFLTGVERQGRDPVGGGGFSDVWKGTYKGDLVAVKVLRIFARQVTADLTKALSCEALVWYTLDHPNVQPFLGMTTFGSDEAERYGLVTPWMAAGDLMAYLSVHRSVSRVRMIDGIARGMDYLHYQNIVHADLRGENILVDNDGNPRITDFGLSRIRSTEPDSSRLSFASGGTRRFQAPELLLPASVQSTGEASDSVLDYCTGDPTTRSDMYALAMTCVQVFTGNPPFAGMREEQIMLGVVNNMRPDRPQDALRELSDKHWDVIQQAWAQRPNDRPDTATFKKRWKRASN